MDVKPESKVCCAPRAHRIAPPPSKPGPGRASDALKAACEECLVTLKGGFFQMGARKSRYPADLDSPPRRVMVDSFRIGRTSITNALFAQFVDETGYRTTAEQEGWSYVFQSFLDRPGDFPDHAAQTPWWRRVDGACWSLPEGPGSSIGARMDHPVVHISWDDAAAFCAHTDMRLPTEAQWEYAARGGKAGLRHPWGNALVPASGHGQNVWQGPFPLEDLADDGYRGTAPVGAYAPNGFGLFNMTGNVWEWCADWFGPLPQGVPSRPPKNPQGPPEGPGRVIRGGSYLCHASYCERYFVHSRTWNTPDSTTGHMGFRIAAGSET